MKRSNKQKNNQTNQEVCVTLVLSPVCNASSKTQGLFYPLRNLFLYLSDTRKQGA